MLVLARSAAHHTAHNVPFSFFFSYSAIPASPILLCPDGCTHVLVLATRPAVQHTTLQRYVRGTVVWAVKKTVLNAPYMSEAWASDLAEEGVLCSCVILTFKVHLWAVKKSQEDSAQCALLEQSLGL